MRLFAVHGLLLPGFDFLERVERDLEVRYLRVQAPPAPEDDEDC